MNLGAPGRAPGADPFPGFILGAIFNGFGMIFDGFLMILGNGFHFFIRHMQTLTKELQTFCKQKKQTLTPPCWDPKGLWDGTEAPQGPDK